MPRPALEQYLALVEDFETYGLFSTAGVGQKAEATREVLAALLGCGPAQIAFTGNATDGTNLVLAGLAWQPGDEVITTDEEHEAINHPLLYLQKSRGSVCGRVSCPDQVDARTVELSSHHAPAPRLSHVTCETGTRLPVAELCTWARERHLLSLVDGAQSLGAIRTDVTALGCDFFTGNGHKWLCGPKGTGLFYASPETLGQLSPAHVGAGSLEKADVATDLAELWPSGRRFEFGTRATTLYGGLGYSLAWLGSLGWEAIERYVAALSDALKARILDRPYLRLLTPRPFDHAAGLTTFVMDSWDAGEVSRELWRRGHIRVRVIPHYNGIRISTDI